MVRYGGQLSAIVIFEESGRGANLREGENVLHLEAATREATGQTPLGCLQSC